MLALVFVITTVLMILISKIWPQDYKVPDKIIAKVDMTPWKHAKAAGIVISILAIATYVSMSQ